jgi:7,8-dihydropterin-6-yl-methyl-4-(beta-D-ribofuranosyl)aminobenzene 5'-phosphate synthase
MKITVLVENSLATGIQEDLRPEHGISLFIEFSDRKILFDSGQSDLYIRNAEKMGIDISEADYLIISHGHFDHGGGLKHFLKINSKAQVYIHRKAAGRFFTRIAGLIPYYVGLDQEILAGNNDRIVFIDSDSQIEDNMVILEGFPELFPQPVSNRSLYEKTGSGIVRDMFQHEIALLLTEGMETVLISGCSHSGIINIMKKAKEYSKGMEMKAVFGGFHIHNPVNRKNESNKYINELTEALKEADTTFYTGHCTGQKNFSIIKEKLGRRILPMSTGDRFELRQRVMKVYASSSVE